MATDEASIDQRIRASFARQGLMHARRDSAVSPNGQVVLGAWPSLQHGFVHAEGR